MSIDKVETFEPRRVLSIQSHVVSGYVGNKAAIFPMQLLGFDVDSINSVQFSNHTGYEVVKGTVITGKDLDDISVGLQSNQIDNYNYLLTGYIGSESFLVSILSLLDRLEISNPGIKFVCDPVLGDAGKLYVPAALVPVFRSRVVPRAWLITPNQYEAELLTGVTIKSEVDVFEALRVLHSIGPKIVVITSTELDTAPGILSCYSSELSDSGSLTISKITVDKKRGHFTGTGDCLASLLLAWNDKLGRTGIAFYNSISTIQAIIENSITIQNRRKMQAVQERLCDKEITASNVDSFLINNEKHKFAELCIIQSKSLIENPPLGNLEISSFSL